MKLDYFKLECLKYNDERERIECLIEDQYEPIIQSFGKFIEDKDSNGDYYKWIESLDRRIVNQFINRGFIDMNIDSVRQFFYPIYSPFLKDTILFGSEYDSKLREWLGNDYQWKLLYRASEHEYSAKSFHQYCDGERPTLVIIKSSGGWIFGGYTTESWSGDGISNEMIYNNQ